MTSWRKRNKVSRFVDICFRRQEMTGFDKWFDRQHRKEIQREFGEDVWKAALNWVLSLDSDFCQCGCLEMQIEEELNAKV